MIAQAKVKIADVVAYGPKSLAGFGPDSTVAMRKNGTYGYPDAQWYCKKIA